MRKNKTDVIVWSWDGGLQIDIPKGTPLHTMSDGTLRVSIKTPKGEKALERIVDCIGRPLVKA